MQLPQFHSALQHKIQKKTKQGFYLFNNAVMSMEFTQIQHFTETKQ